MNAWTCKGNKGLFPRTNFGTSWKKVVSFMPRLRYPRERPPLRNDYELWEFFVVPVTMNKLCISTIQLFNSHLKLKGPRLRYKWLNCFVFVCGTLLTPRNSTINTNDSFFYSKCCRNLQAYPITGHILMKLVLGL